MMNPRHQKSTYAGITILLDAFLIVFALGIGYAINFPSFSVGSFLSHQWKLVLYSIVLYLGLSATLGVYRQAFTSPLRIQVAAAVRAYAIGTLIVFATLFLFRNTYYSNGILLTYVVLIPSAFLFVRLGLERVRTRLHRQQWGLEPTLIVLMDDDGREHLRELATDPSFGFDIRNTVNAASMDAEAAGQCITELISLLRPTCLMFSSRNLDSPGLSTLLTFSSAWGVTVRLVSPEIHDALTRMRLYDFAGVAISAPEDVAVSRLLRLLKRSFDIVFSIVLLCLTAPLLLLIAVAIRYESKGGVFFRQVRSLTPTSRPVRVFKFRSMAHNAGELPDANGKPGDDQVLSKSPADPRVTRVGRFIRKYSLDELPQLFNVLVGEMSLVGPRPLPLADFRKLPPHGTIASLYERRGRVKPGLTGLWQISGRSGLNFRQMAILDLYYAENQTFLFDLEILFETIPAVISGRGAY